MMQLALSRKKNQYLEYAVQLSSGKSGMQNFRDNALNALLDITSSLNGCLLGINQTGDHLTAVSKKNVEIGSPILLGNNSNFVNQIKCAWKEEKALFLNQELVLEEGIISHSDTLGKNNVILCLPIIANSSFKNLACLLWNIDGHYTNQQQINDLTTFGKIIAALHDWHHLIDSNRFNERLLNQSIAHLSKSSDKLKQTMPKILKTRMLGNSLIIENIREKIIRYSASDKSILISGETGSGKDLTAELLHVLSPMNNNNFVRKKITAIPDDEVLKELFGYVDDKAIIYDGLFKQANNGTLYLDEIDKTSPQIQKYILDVLESGEIKPVGCDDKFEVKSRLIVSTNDNLEQLVKNGKFRKDLYFRLKQLVIDIAPLRDREQDSTFLAKYFLTAALQRYKKSYINFSSEALKIIQDYSFPGNVRELQVFCEILALHISKDIIDADDITEHLGLDDLLKDINQMDSESPISESTENYPKKLQEACQLFERKFIVDCFNNYNGDRKLIAEILDIPKSTLADKLKRYKIG
jgi:sigma-54-specific transcriptional regulator